MTIGDTVSTMIGDIYAGVHEKAQWDRVMEDVTAKFDASLTMTATIDLHALRPSEAHYYRAETSRCADALFEYQDYQWQFDPTLHHLATSNGKPFDSHTLCADADDYLAHSYVQWNQASFGSTFWRMLNTTSDDLTFGISLHRSHDSGPLTPSDQTLMTMLFGHMDNAVRLSARSPCLASDDTILLLDGYGHLMHASDRASELLRSRDGLSIVGKSLSASNRHATSALDAAIRIALHFRSGGGMGGAVTLPRPTGRALLATIKPLPATGPYPDLQAAVLIRVVDPDDTPVLAGVHWRTLFGFTPSECRLAETLITNDGTLRDAADILGIAYATARVHLANLFEKAEVRSQVQLVRLLMKLN